MRILVTGSRDWDEAEIIYLALAQTIKESLDLDGSVLRENPVIVVHGKCPTGADQMASDYVKITGLDGIIEEAHPARWDAFGKRAGFIRNKAMVDLGADVCLAFIKNNSRGASMTAKLAREAGIRVEEFRL